MAIGDIIVGIDIGTSKVCISVGKINSFSQIEMVCTTASSCKGISKSVITDKESIINAIGQAAKEAQTLSRDTN